jgi:hypothetical protein
VKLIFVIVAFVRGIIAASKAPFPNGPDIDDDGDDAAPHEAKAQTGIPAAD